MLLWVLSDMFRALSSNLMGVFVWFVMASGIALLFAAAATPDFGKAVLIALAVGAGVGLLLGMNGY